MTGFALNILDIHFAAVQVPIPHRLGTGMAINAVERPFTTGELGNGLVVIMQPVSGEVLAGGEGHRAQVVVATVVAGIALGVRDGGGELMNLGWRAGILSVGTVWGLGGCMAGSATGKTVIIAAGQRLGGKVTGEAVLSESPDRRIGFLGRIERRQGGDAAGTPGHLDGKYSQAGSQVRLGAKGVTECWRWHRRKWPGCWWWHAGYGRCNFRGCRCGNLPRRRRPGRPRNPKDSYRRAWCCEPGLHPEPGARHHDRARSQMSGADGKLLIWARSEWQVRQYST